MVTLSTEQFRRVGVALFTAAGVSSHNAERTVDSLISASLAGHDSHGIIRYVQYLEAVQKGHVNPDGSPDIVKETPVTALVDGNWIFGQVAAGFAMQLALAKAKEHGIALVSLIRSYHIGRLGEYSEMANAAGMIGVTLAGGFAGTGGRSAAVAPFGGAAPVFSTNPISFGVPAGEQGPVMVDFATSAVAGGKISHARAQGSQLPPNSIIDKDGKPTTDPEEFYRGGMMLPFGGHKGYGLAVVIELLGQAFTGADAAADPVLGGGIYSSAGTVFIAIDPTLFRSYADYAASADATLAKIKAVPPAPGFQEVLLPGEPQARNTASRRVEGITMPDSSWQRVHELAAELGVDLEAMLV